jgi:hypothetical protein
MRRMEERRERGEERICGEWRGGGGAASREGQKDRRIIL